jgi:hypothetical protein
LVSSTLPLDKIQLVLQYPSHFSGKSRASINVTEYQRLCLSLSSQQSAQLNPQASPEWNPKNAHRLWEAAECAYSLFIPQIRQSLETVLCRTATKPCLHTGEFFSLYSVLRSFELVPTTFQLSK